MYDGHKYWLKLWLLKFPPIWHENWVCSSVTNPFQTIQREDIGIKLKVKPQINEGNAVQLEIEQEVSSISRSSLAATDIVTNKRTIKTTVIVEDGNMVIQRNLMVFLHPVILRDAASENFLSQSKYSYMRAKQLSQKNQGLSLMSADEIPVLPNLDDFLTILPGKKNLTSKEIEPQLYKKWLYWIVQRINGINGFSVA